MELWYLQMPSSIPNFSFALLVSDIKMGSQNLMWGLLAPWHTPYAETFMSSPSNWQDQTVCQISVSYALCSYANMYFPQAFYYMYQIMGFEGEGVKILCSNPQKALPCVNTRLLVYRMSKPVQRPEL